nr:MAG TPA: hypothetical protein [Caudoviricetes sp.]
MNDRKFVKFLEEIAGKDKLTVSFPLTEFMQWADIPFDNLESVFSDVNRTLRRLMEYKSKLEEKILFLEKKTFARVVPSYTTIGLMIEVEFAEWTREVRQEDWLLKIVEEMENAK